MNVMSAQMLDDQEVAEVLSYVGKSWGNDVPVFTPEEMDWVRPGFHYGFPYQFSDWPSREGFPYSHTPARPEAFTFTLPVVNIGPAGGASQEMPMSTFTPHSSPGGIFWCGSEYPEPFRNGFL